MDGAMQEIQDSTVKTAEIIQFALKTILHLQRVPKSKEEFHMSPPFEKWICSRRDILSPQMDVPVKHHLI